MVAGTFAYLTMKGAESLYSSRKAMISPSVTSPSPKQNLKEDHGTFSPILIASGEADPLVLRCRHRAIAFA